MPTVYSGYSPAITQPAPGIRKIVPGPMAAKSSLSVYAPIYSASSRLSGALTKTTTPPPTGGLGLKFTTATLVWDKVTGTTAYVLKRDGVVVNTKSPTATTAIVSLPNSPTPTIFEVTANPSGKKQQISIDWIAK